MSQKKEAYKAGKTHGISGRELFEFNPEYVKGDDDEAGEDDVIMLRREVRLGIYRSPPPLFVGSLKAIKLYQK